METVSAEINSSTENYRYPIQNYFIGWQCRVRELALRSEEGRPNGGMRQKIALKNGKVVFPAATLLIIPEHPDQFIRQFHFMALKTQDPKERYTVEGLRSVPPALHDAGSMSGVTRLQRLFKIEYPLAFPHIMLGINQTVVFALFMVIIGAMIGTEDLGQYILKALSDLKGGGKGLILGLCVAFIGLAVDNLIRTWAEKRKIFLGLS